MPAGDYKDEQFVNDIALYIAGAIDDYRSDLPEVLWTSALTMIDGAVDRTRNWHWWRSHPRSELGRLRERIAHALMLARFAADMQEAENRHERELDRELLEQAAEAGRQRRRAQTRPATEARLAKLAARKAELARIAEAALAGDEPLPDSTG